MFKSLLKLALRNLFKRRASTAVNVFSLAIGLTCCAIIALFIQHEFAFDKGFERGEDIYRITSDFGKNASAPTTTFIYPKYLKSEIPEIEEVARLDATYGTVVVQSKESKHATPFQQENGYWVDPSFFNIFSFHFQYGNRASALTQPNTIVLSQEVAAKIFGNTDPIGKTVGINGTNYAVSGVFKQDMLNHFNADFFASNNSTGIRERNAVKLSWVMDPNYYVYIKLRHGADINHVKAEINSYTKRHGLAEMKSANAVMTNSLQALNRIHLYSANYPSYMEVKQGNIRYLYMLGTVALAVLVLGCINYINLTTAQALSRAREVGVRRTMGASQSSVRYQFLLETVTVSLLALFTAGVLALISLPVFNQVTGQHLSFFAPENRTLVFWLLSIALATGILAGTYPAIYLSSFKPVLVLKGKISNSAASLSVRKILIVAQLAVSMCLVFSCLVIYFQLRFIINKKPGFDQDQQLVINLNSEQARKNNAFLSQQLASNPSVVSVTSAGAALASGDMNMYPSDKSVADKQSVVLDLVDKNYISALGLTLLRGSNFSTTTLDTTADKSDLEVNAMGREIILNQSAVKALGFTLDDAVGKSVSHFHNGVVYRYRVAGVVADYHFYSLYSPIGPEGLIVTRPDAMNCIIVKVRGGKIAQAVDLIDKAWRQINPDMPFNYVFLDQVFQWDYQQDERQQQLTGIFTLVAILVSGIGLFGMITYTVGQKAKEIGIRKVIGAGVMDIVVLFSGQYLRLVVIANLIAWPIAWYFMHQWLQSFAYRISISWRMFAASLLTGVVVVMATISFKTIRAGMANPVDSLRSE